MSVFEREKYVKVPVIMQMSSVECGAASVAMVLGYHGKWLPMSEIREACGVSRDGVSGKKLLAAVRGYGMTAKGKRVTEIDPDEIPLPCILHYNNNHFVVFCGYHKGKAVINDPARGRIYVTEEEFKSSFHGLLMICVPGEEFMPEGEAPSSGRIILKQARQYKKEIAFVLLAGFTATIIGIITPALNEVFLNHGIIGNNKMFARGLLLMLLIMFVFEAAITVVNVVTKFRINRRVAMDSGSRFFEHLLRLDMNFYSGHSIGDLINRQKSTESISQNIVQQVVPVLQQFATIVLYVAIMLYYNVTLAVVGITMSIVSIIISVIVMERQMDMIKAQVQHQAVVRSYSMFGFHSIESLKASGAERGFFNCWADMQAEYHNRGVDVANASAWLASIPELMQKLSGALIIVIGAALIMDGRFTLGALVAFQSFLTAFHKPVNTVNQIAQTIQQMRIQLERTEDVLVTPADPMDELEIPETWKELEGSISVKNVQFGYGKLQPPVIDDISFELELGKSIGIAGGSGCGKSTLINVLLGLYQVWNGQIEYGGMPVEKIPRAYFARYAGIVRQTPTVIPGTVRDNLKLWNVNITDEQMIRAAKDAGIHDIIMQRSEGYDTQMAERGANFSGGQLQKMELARALMNDPKILILDEATSALDAETEAKIIGVLKQRRITSVIVAHRLSTIRECDEIMVMRKGRVVQRGRHEELMNQDGPYRSLIESEKYDGN